MRRDFCSDVEVKKNLSLFKQEVKAEALTTLQLLEKYPEANLGRV